MLMFQLARRVVTTALLSIFKSHLSVQGQGDNIPTTP